jgi:phosphate uptake regulator
MHRVDVMIGQRLIVVLPDRDVDLGTVAEGDEVAIERQAGGALSVRVMPSGAGAQVRVSA